MTQNIKSPFFSIITPSYNRAGFLPDTISSVLKQTFESFEYIIVDDASTDNSKEVVESFNEPRLVYLRNEKNMERGASRNRAISVARGKYICFLDSDDEFMENHLEVLHKNITDRNEPVALLFTKSYQRFGNKPLEKRGFKPIEKYSIFKYILRFTFNHNCVAIHRNILDEYKYDPDIPGLEDLDLWLHIALKYPIISIIEYTNILNFHEGSYTTGDYYSRAEKELKNFKHIFSKKEFKGLLPLIPRGRLYNFCYFYLAMKYEEEGKILKMYKCIFLSILTFPFDYSRNKVMFVMTLYHIPLLGKAIKRIVRLKKR